MGDIIFINKILRYTLRGTSALFVMLITFEILSVIAIESHLISAETPNYHAPSINPFWIDDNPNFGMWHPYNEEYTHTKSCFSVRYTSNSYGARDKERSKESHKLLSWGMSNFDLVEINNANESIENVEVWLGKKKFVKAYVNENIYKIIPKARKKNLKVSVIYNGPIHAPIKKDDILGKLILSYKGEFLKEYSLLAFEDVKKLNAFSRFIKSINYLIWGDV